MLQHTNEPSKTVDNTGQNKEWKVVKEPTVSVKSVSFPTNPDELSWISYKEMIACFAYSLVKRYKGDIYEDLGKLVSEFENYIRPVFVMLSPIRYEVNSYDEIETCFTEQQLACILNATSICEWSGEFKNLNLASNEVDSALCIQTILEEVLKNVERKPDLENVRDEN